MRNCVRRRSLKQKRNFNYVPVASFEKVPNEVRN